MTRGTHGSHVIKRNNDYPSGQNNNIDKADNNVTSLHGRSSKWLSKEERNALVQKVLFREQLETSIMRLIFVGISVPLILIGLLIIVNLRS